MLTTGPLSLWAASEAAVIERVARANPEPEE